MSQLIRAEGIVLHSLRHGETSRIVTLFTREHGKFGIIAKGARTKKGGVGAALELFTRGDFLYYQKPTRDIQLLKEVSLLDAHSGLRQTLPLLSIASALAELCHLTLKDEDPHPDIYDSLDASLAALDKAPPNPLPILWKFELQLFAALGFALSLDHCSECRSELRPPFSARVGFLFENGSFVEPKCQRKSKTDGTLSAEAFSALNFIGRHPIEQIGRVALSAGASSEIQDFLGKYLSYHLPVRGHLRSLAALRWEKEFS
jgi:DNA repair protein RecO (recombination protein O)